MSSSGLLEVDPSRQWEWHEAFRDLSKNQYRTTYTDMAHFKEVNVKSDYPSGYGGHIPNIRHDVLFRNTAFDRVQALRRNDPSRDAHPSFKDHIAGIPTWCAKPQGAKKNPTYGVIPHDGTTTNIICPWAVVRPVKQVPSYRNVPATLKRTRSMPGLGGSRLNPAAMSAGLAAMSSSPVAASTGQLPMVQQPAPALVASPMAQSPGADRLKHTVSMANEQAYQQQMPSEQEMLMEEMNFQDTSQDWA